MTPFPKDFREFLSLLSKHRVRYLVIGGYALGYHGYVRATGDLDIFVEVSDDNADRLVQVFREFGFSEALDRGLFMRKGDIVRVGYPPLRLEILTEISGVTFEECYPKRVTIDFDEVSVDFIDRDSLIKNKRSTGRSKDQADVDQLG